MCHFYVMVAALESLDSAGYTVVRTDFSRTPTVRTQAEVPGQILVPAGLDDAAAVASWRMDGRMFCFTKGPARTAVG